ncbi:MAG TPA: amidohydrolase family protein [Steroidobacteraceae bacterium]|nr:amidohydrolase family protein [Steroidobacteraceae bacterium]
MKRSLTLWALLFVGAAAQAKQGPPEQGPAAQSPPAQSPPAQSMAARGSIAIIHGKVWTLTGDTPVENATVIVKDGKIVSVVAGAAAPAGARVIDAKGRPVTPGLIHPATHLGLIEVSAATETVDTGTKVSSLGAGFDIQYAINPDSALIQLARADGLTRAISYPTASGVPPFAGLGALLRLSDSGDVLEHPGIGVFVSIGGRRDGGSRAAQWEELRRTLDSAKTSLAAPAGATTGTPEILALEPVLSGKEPLALSTNRESDLRQAIKLAADYSLHVIIIGGADAWMVADALAAARIPVVVDPQDNLPANFDELGARLDNAALLHGAGVTVATAVRAGIHQSYHAGLSLREGAGLAVANGLPYIDALRSITLVPAQIWGISAHCGTLAAGKDADLVVWDGDPLEPASAPVTVLIRGKEVSLVTRQTRLRDRYMSKAGLAKP